MKKIVGLIVKLAFAVAVVYGCVELIYAIENWLGLYNNYTKVVEVAEVAFVVCVVYVTTTLATKLTKKAISLIGNRRNTKVNLVIYGRES